MDVSDEFAESNSLSRIAEVDSIVERDRVYSLTELAALYSVAGFTGWNISGEVIMLDAFRETAGLGDVIDVVG